MGMLPGGKEGAQEHGSSRLHPQVASAWPEAARGGTTTQARGSTVELHGASGLRRRLGPGNRRRWCAARWCWRLG
jgi:hypothetical protein